jgi:AcrR family transcriptional regulator
VAASGDGRTKRGRGRPPSEAAAAHEQILDAVHDMLHETRLRDLTIEAVAKRAGVGKPTIYKWWPSKAALVLDTFEERVVRRLRAVDPADPERAIRAQVAELIRLLNGFFGKVAADLIAEGQADPAVLRAYRDRYVTKRRAFTRDLIDRAQRAGTFRRDVGPDLLIDMIYGPIYYRLLLRHQKLDKRFGEELVDHVMRYVKG